MKKMKLSIIILAIPLTIFILINSLHQAGIRLNVSESEPIGFYLMRTINKQSIIQRNDLIEFCPNIKQKDFPFVFKGYCPGGVMPFLKHIIGIPGDSVKETDEGVWINKRKIDQSKPINQSKTFGIILPRWRGERTLAQDEYWVYGSGDTKDSFDSRYYGPIKERQIISIKTGKFKNERIINYGRDKF